MFKTSILTVSDKGFEGKREDISGKILKDIIESKGYIVVENCIVPDDTHAIKNALIGLAEKSTLILTTGGTGFSTRDNTPEATQAVCHKMVPGISEAMRFESLKITPQAMLSRGVSGIRNNTLIINLPGSPKAVKENLEVILPVLEHGLKILVGLDSECGS